MSTQPPPGWYPDPYDPGRERYWSGAGWTDDLRPRSPLSMAAKPSNHLAFAIVVTVLCCLPFGIVAIVYAARVDSLWAAGDVMGAYRASEAARNWSIAAVVAMPLLLVSSMVLLAGA